MDPDNPQPRGSRAFHADRLPVLHEYLAICTPPWPRTDLAVALGAGCSFVARAIDSDRTHLAQILTAAAKHRGTSFVEMYQNCPIFNDGNLVTQTPIGILRNIECPTYDDQARTQVQLAAGDTTDQDSRDVVLATLLTGNGTWQV
ncbi:2-oxoglutarate ferredoxin oxidoreductase subunit beta [Cutibacterium modestum 30N]|nr:2-oxoglutarate ferredoxin oxidoreductase subunit beta [Cutibacterium modestum 28N]MCP2380311.1 2-oxoglutarate ferredoxin oxidoreductase subunit beta [Cutibacterium modestum 30N]